MSASANTVVSFGKVQQKFHTSLIVFCIYLNYSRLVHVELLIRSNDVSPASISVGIVGRCSIDRTSADTPETECSCYAQGNCVVRAKHHFANVYVHRARLHDSRSQCPFDWRPNRSGSELQESYPCLLNGNGDNPEYPTTPAAT